MKFIFTASAIVISCGLLVTGCSSSKKPESSNQAMEIIETRSRQDKMKSVIAIDGHAGSGKGTLAEKLAKRYGFAHFDTGILYRYVAYKGLSPIEVEKLSLDDIFNDLKEIPQEILRSDQVGAKTAEMAKLPEIRRYILRLQRDFIASPGKYAGTVMEGRDIGSVVVPDAVCKLFVTARLDVRARRRLAFLKQKNPNVTYEEVYENMKKRDFQDENRKESPLVCNSSYSIIDTSDETVDESFDKASKIVAKNLYQYSKGD
ncbi:MAG: (d)CMP kinase [Holosporaceae bacterium]|jgi:cytidylate kinase|nr:(d)CMP kinase [Holosporaceae bacterium]